MNLFISPSGQIHCLYGEAISLAGLGRCEIRRASHVEPTAEGEWTADLCPINGPILGPFSERSQALEAEVTWIENNHLSSRHSHS